MQCLKINKCQNTKLTIGSQQLVAWELSAYSNSIDNLVIENCLEYLTAMEGDACLIDWFKSLMVGGSIELRVTDAEYYMRQWLDARWDEKSIKDPQSAARISSAKLYGSQQCSNPRFADYNQSYENVYKSAYSQSKLTFLLERVGFTGVEIVKEQGMLIAKATKTMNYGERQISTSYEAIRQDHKNRYIFAADKLAQLESKIVLDLACGIGYGSKIIAQSTKSRVTAVDIDLGAIQYAKEYFAHENVDFICKDALKLDIDENSVDAITSFETIEHIDFDRQLLILFYKWLKPEGTLICSTPNESVMPFNKAQFKYHVKHYTVPEITALVESVGFVVTETYKQADCTDGDISIGEDGAFCILVCKKVC
ncbi:class I SAM-dependent methyltransferase [Catenovulum sediminis]|uniref:class I SAM-dependent methyltransferase n=1 Tax=Catenovulum sediminis TaxID=1740262 RepID=UPI001FEAB287|nr:methyltransferase domain-containing protein [Catenovulum sediminis]